ncbi:hypothetical protein HYY69_08440 [Candidatus Woesearchaeota archaeon]|nr:hypothetical protein [Candidatus Woesearchaeota archaeon]
MILVSKKHVHSNKESDDLKTVEIKAILRRLFNQKRIGGRHTEEKNCLKCMKYLPRDAQKLVYEDWETCIKNEWILRKKSTGEWHVSLNPEKLGEILHEIE